MTAFLDTPAIPGFAPTTPPGLAPASPPSDKVEHRRLLGMRMLCPPRLTIIAEQPFDGSSHDGAAHAGATAIAKSNASNQRRPPKPLLVARRERFADDIGTGPRTIDATTKHSTGANIDAAADVDAETDDGSGANSAKDAALAATAALASRARWWPLC